MAFVQAVEANASSGSTCAVTLTGVTAGNTIVVLTEIDSATITVSSIKDGVPNTYTLLDAVTSGTKSTRSAYFQNTPGGSVTVTATFSASGSTFRRMLVCEYSGLGAPDGHAAAATTATGAGQAESSGNFTDKYMGDTIVALANASTSTLTAGSGFTLDANNPGSQGMYAESGVVAGPGTTSATFTSGANGQTNFVHAMAFAGQPAGQPSLGDRPWMRERPPDRSFFPQGSPALQAPPPVTQPPTPHDWPLPVRVFQPDRSYFDAALPIAIPPTPKTLVTNFDQPLPKVPWQPDRSLFVSPLGALLNSIFPGQPQDWPLPVRVQQPDRSLLTATAPILVPPPPPTPPPIPNFSELPVRVQQPDRSLFSTAWAALIPCASFNSSYSDAYCGGVHPRWLQTWFVGLPPRGPELDRTAMVGLNLQLLFPAKPAPAPAPSPIIVAAQPNRSFYQSAVPSTIPQNTPPIGAHFFDLPKVAPQPNRSHFQGQLPSTIPNIGLPVIHGQSENPRTVDQFNRSLFHGHLPFTTTQPTPPPTHPLPGLPQTPFQFNRTVLSSSLLPDFSPGAIPFRPLPQIIHPVLRTFDYTAFGRYPILIPAPKPPHPPHPHPWNPPKLPTDQWTVVGSGSQQWTKVTSGTQSWQSKPIPNS